MVKHVVCQKFADKKDAETAAQVQDEFMEYCINQLNG